MTNDENRTSEKRKGFLSLLWIFVSLNYLYCDVMGLMDPVLLRQYLGGAVNQIPLTQPFFLGAAVLMEVPLAMVVLSRVLGSRVGRWANVTAGAFMTLVQTATLVAIPSPAGYYLFFSAVEVLCTSAIVVLAWKKTEKDENNGH